MVVVNGVMEGFFVEMQDRVHGVLSDVVFESQSLNGFEDPELHMKEINKVVGEYVEGMTPTTVAFLRIALGATVLRLWLRVRGVPGLRPEAASWLDQLDTEYKDARERAAETLGAFEALAAGAIPHNRSSA